MASERSLTPAEIALTVVLSLNVVCILWILLKPVPSKPSRPEAKRIQISAKLPSSSLSRLVELPHGSTHYFCKGEENPGNLVVCIHGDEGNYADFLSIALQLSKRMRVLCFDLFGNGYSSDDGYMRSKKLFVSQLSELLFKLDENDPLHIIGHGWGATVAAHFAKLFPEKVTSMSLLSPGFFGKNENLSFGMATKFQALLKDDNTREPGSGSKSRNGWCCSRSRGSGNGSQTRNDSSSSKTSTPKSSCASRLNCCSRAKPSRQSKNDGDNEQLADLCLPWVNPECKLVVEYRQRMARSQRKEPAMRQEVSPIKIEPIKPDLHHLSLLDVPVLIVWGTKSQPGFGRDIIKDFSQGISAEVEGYSETFHIENPEATCEVLFEFFEDFARDICSEPDPEISLQESSFTYSYIQSGQENIRSTNKVQAKKLSPVRNVLTSPRSQGSSGSKRLKIISPAKKETKLLAQKEEVEEEIQIDIPNSPDLYHWVALQEHPELKLHRNSRSSTKPAVRKKQHVQSIAVHVNDQAKAEFGNDST